MRAQDLKPLKEIAEFVRQPAHRIIHLCERGVVEPVVAARGRGSVRRFDRNNTYRILLALQLQNLGLQIDMIKPLMEDLDLFMEIPEIQRLKEEIEDYDTVTVIDHLGDFQDPCLAFVMNPKAGSNRNEIAFCMPRLKIVPRRNPSVNLVVHNSAFRWGHFLSVNLSIVAGVLV